MSVTFIIWTKQADIYALYYDFFWLSPPEVLEEAEGLLHSHPTLHQLELVCDEEPGPSTTGVGLEVETPLAMIVFRSFPETAP